MLPAMTDPLTELRGACAKVARRAHHVAVENEAIPGYGAGLADAPRLGCDDSRLVEGSREELAAFWLTLDAINFGSGWFPTLRKRPNRSGYFTIACGLRDRFQAHGPWPAAELANTDAAQVAAVLGQEPDHELMGLFARSLRDLGGHVGRDHEGRFAAV